MTNFRLDVGFISCTQDGTHSCEFRLITKKSLAGIPLANSISHILDITE